MLIPGLRRQVKPSGSPAGAITLRHNDFSFFTSLAYTDLLRPLVKIERWVDLAFFTPIVPIPGPGSRLPDTTQTRSG